MQMHSAPVPVEDYLSTSFDDGDREYVDGKIVGRNLGEKDHSRLLRQLVLFFGGREARDGVLRTAGPDIELELVPLF